MERRGCCCFVVVCGYGDCVWIGACWICFVCLSLLVVDLLCLDCLDLIVLLGLFWFAGVWWVVKLMLFVLRWLYGV